MELTGDDYYKILRGEVCKRCNTIFARHSGFPPNLCTPCRIDDWQLQKDAVMMALKRPIDSTAKKTLTVGQWIANLKYFNGRCAYCRKEDYACLEHFIPIRLGGGTDASNIVPSCLSCNARKKHIHPALVTNIPQEDINRVRSYLQQLL